jgi:hypothetical protein
MPLHCPRLSTTPKPGEPEPKPQASCRGAHGIERRLRVRRAGEAADKAGGERRGEEIQRNPW